VKYISKILEVEGPVSAALLALGDGNWKIGKGIQVGQESKGCDGLEEGSENVVLEHFIRKSTFSFFPSRLPHSAPPFVCFLCLFQLLIPKYSLTGNLCYRQRHPNCHNIPPNNLLPTLTKCKDSSDRAAGLTA
jgi:exocyst complex protein 7